MSEIKRDPYEELGVSSKKEGVHEATKGLNKGLYPGAFCQIVGVPKTLPKEVQDNYVQVIHSDGVGTKSNVAYIAMKEGITDKYLYDLAQDAVVMNTDDMACVGVTDDIYISNHIGRNANRVDDEAISKIIKGYANLYDRMGELGINLYNAGGETADVGSYTTTVGIDVTASAILPKDKVIDNSNIAPHQYIVGLASFGQATYEDRENSGIRSNGLTLAINTLLSPYYRKYTETMDGTVDPNKLFTGKYMLEDKLEGSDMTVGDAILSPTRTYLPVLKDLIDNEVNIRGIIHCSGGGLTKSINFGNNIVYQKYNVGAFKTPAIFRNIQRSGGIDKYYMYQTFNMGVGMEIIVDTMTDACKVIDICEKYNIYSNILGTTDYSKEGNKVEIDYGKKLVYKK